ncbi:MAG: hypothetical protein WA941_18020 [Nitrososphaeraceae archaeon]
MLKSMDRLAQEGNLFKCFCGSPDGPSTELLTRLKWYDGTIQPYVYPKEEKPMVTNAASATAKNTLITGKYAAWIF